MTKYVLWLNHVLLYDPNDDIDKVAVTHQGNETVVFNRDGGGAVNVPVYEFRAIGPESRVTFMPGYNDLTPPISTEEVPQE